MGIEVVTNAPAITPSGQAAPAIVAPTPTVSLEANGGSNTTDTSAANTTVDAGTNEMVVQAGQGSEGTSNTGVATPPVVNGTPINTKVDSASLTQITQLTTNNRNLTRQVAELTAKVGALAKPNDEISAKLKKLEQYEKAPLHQLIALRNATMEDVAADVFAQANKVDDPRVAQALEEVEKVKSDLAKRDEETKARETAAQSAAQTERQKGAQTYVDGLIKSVKVKDTGEARWPSIATDKDVASRALKAAGDIVERDFGEVKDDTGNVTRAGRQPTQAEAQAIIEDCLDEQEAIAHARKVLEDRKKGGQVSATSVRSGGIEVALLSEMPTQAGSPSPKPTPRPPVVTTGAIPRGPTTAREAKRRALRMVGSDD